MYDHLYRGDLFDADGDDAADAGCCGTKCTEKAKGVWARHGPVLTILWNALKYAALLVYAVLFFQSSSVSITSEPIEEIEVYFYMSIYVPLTASGTCNCTMVGPMFNSTVFGDRADGEALILYQAYKCVARKSRRGNEDYPVLTMDTYLPIANPSDYYMEPMMTTYYVTAAQWLDIALSDIHRFWFETHEWSISMEKRGYFAPAEEQVEMKQTTTAFPLFYNEIMTIVGHLEDLAIVASQFAARGIDVTIATLNGTFSREPWKSVSPLLNGGADYLVHLTALCTMCGDDAAFTAWVDKDRTPDKKTEFVCGESEFVGGADKYEARCRTCFSLVREE